MKMRNHFTYILEQMWGIIFVLIGLLFSSDASFRMAMELFSQGNIVEGLLAFGGVFLIFALICLWYINRWYKTTITVADGTVTIERRTLNRYVNAIAVQNISNINLEQNLFEILVGTYKLKLDTNSLSTANATDVKIVLKKKDAYAMKNLIMQMMKEINSEEGQAPSEDGLPTQDTAFDIDMMEDREESGYDVIYSAKEIVVSCLVNTSILLFVCSLAFLIAAVVTVVYAFSTAKGVLEALGALGGLFVQLMVAGSMITALVKNWLNDFDFRAKRYQDKIYVSCGFIKRKKYAVPVDKINAICFESTFLGRVSRRATVKVINVGGENEDVDGMKILLAGTQQELKERLAVLLPEFAFPNQELLVRQPNRVLYKKVICNALTLCLFSLCAYLGFCLAQRVFAFATSDWVGFIWLAVTCGCLVLFVIFDLLDYLLNQMYVGERELMISRGKFAKSVLCIPYEKIQYLTYIQGPVEHLLGVSRARVNILASTMSQKQMVGAFPVEDYERLHEKLEQSYMSQEKTLG
jgi:uncharacterized membrane protein YdbT with pleckstrin-like domain